MKKYMSVAPDGRIDSVYEVDDAPVPLPAEQEGPPAPGEPAPVVDGFEVHEVTTDTFDRGWPVAPSDTSVLRLIDGAIVWAETATLEQIKARKRAAITAQRLALDGDHFTYLGHAIRTADKDMFDLLVADARISKGVGMPANWVGGWVGINSVLPIATREEWDAFFIAMYDTGIENFMHSQHVKALIDNATTAEDVEAIQW